MNSIIAITVLFMSYGAFACTDLSGTFVCEGSDGQKEEIIVTQRVENNITIYKINNDEFAADGLPKPIDESDVTGQYVVACDMDRVTLTSDVKARDNSYSAHQDGLIYRTPTGLRQQSQVSFVADGKTESFDTSLECSAK